MNPWLEAAYFIGVLIAMVVAVLWSREMGYKAGASDGYERGAHDRDVTLQESYELGRQSGDNWWLGVEAEIEQERRRIWEKEKGKRRA